MEVSTKLAYEFHTILLSHCCMLVLLGTFTTYVYLCGRKTPLLYSYVSVVAMISLWMIAKVFKTVSPIIELRWFFIVVQYWAIDSLSLCFLIFAYVYRKQKVPTKRQFILWGIPPFISFVALASNPWHMSFYTTFDLYRDRFGPAFYMAQSCHYLYLIIGIIMLSKGFTKQPSFDGHRGIGHIFACLVCIPLLGNAYYILFKMDILSWRLPFPVFDFTPIAASISLILFVIPTLRFRFFDIAPITLNTLFNIIPQGVVCADSKGHLFNANQTFLNMLGFDRTPLTIMHLIDNAATIDAAHKMGLKKFFQATASDSVEIMLTDGRLLQFQKNRLKGSNDLICLKDITEVRANHLRLADQNKTLDLMHQKLHALSETTRALAIARTKSLMAQNVHDILGHSLTVVIGTAELASQAPPLEAQKKAIQIEELLTNGLNDLRNALEGKVMNLGETSLIKALKNLANDRIQVDVQINGTPYELNSSQTEAVFRLCQEAITNAIRHGKASKIYLVLRYQSQTFEIFTIDNGIGCKTILKNFGLHGIEERFLKNGGSIHFSSDGETGFTTRAMLPRQGRC